MKTYRITKQEFRLWLQSKSPKTKAGLSSDINYCPIAKFIKQKEKVTRVEVNDSSIYFKRKNGTFLLKDISPWVIEFIQKYDHYNQKSGYLGHSVYHSVKTTLEILNNL